VTSRGCYTVVLGGDSLKQKLDSISDTVTDNVRETGMAHDEWRLRHLPCLIAYVPRF